MKHLANYHTHTHLCHHAQGVPLDYVQQANKEGCLALGFSDHCPYPESFGDVWPHIRMSVEEIPVYLNDIEQARQIAKFPVYAGYECEWDRDFDAWYDELRSKHGAQYLVLGSHWVTEGSSHVYPNDFSNIKQIVRYTDQTIDGMRSGHFDFLAHPDLVMMSYKEWDDEIQACMKAIIDAAADLDLPLEINGLGASRTPNNTKRGMRYPYPYVEFWEMVAQTKVRVLCNSDAHDPQDVIMNNWKARDFAGRFGIEVMDTLPIKG